MNKLRMSESLVVLKEITLFGIGPYLNPARIELAPLTILCGTNGSGKSTWIDVLRHLQDRATRDRFPFEEFDPRNDGSGEDQDEDENSVDEQTERSTFYRSDLNANLIVKHVNRGDDAADDERLDTARKNRVRELVTLPPLDKYGPIGTIGLFSTVTGQLRLENVPLQGHHDNRAAKLLHSWFPEGAIAGPTSVRIRWARPEILKSEYEETEMIEPQLFLPYELQHWFEIAIGDDSNRKIVRFSNDAVPQIEFIEGRAHSLVVAKGDTEFGGAKDLFGTIYQELVTRVLAGFFPIGPIRQIHAPEMVDAKRSKYNHSGIYDFVEVRNPEYASRWVGYQGEYSQTRHVEWVYDLMRQPDEPFTGHIESDFVEKDFDWSKHDYGHDEPDIRVVDAYSELPAEIRDHILNNLVDVSLKNEWNDAALKRCNEVAIKVLNQALQSRNLYRSELPWDRNYKDEMNALIDAGIENLSIDEVRRLNRLLIESVFPRDSLYPGCDPTRTRCVHRTGFVFETFVSYWLNHLLDTQIQFSAFPHGSLDTLWTQDKQHPPTGGLVGTASQKWIGTLPGQSHEIQTPASTFKR